MVHGYGLEKFFDLGDGRRRARLRLHDPAGESIARGKRRRCHDGGNHGEAGQNHPPDVGGDGWRQTRARAGARATDDPTEMMDIVQAWRGKYDVYLFAYNYHRPVRTIAADFVNEIKRLRLENRFGDGVTFVAYSYGAIVFREAVIITDDRTLFSDASLIQLVPTRRVVSGAQPEKSGHGLGGVAILQTDLRRKSQRRFCGRALGGCGKSKFYDVINPGRVHSILVAGDPHSLAGIATQMSARDTTMASA